MTVTLISGIINSLWNTVKCFQTLKSRLLIAIENMSNCCQSRGCETVLFHWPSRPVVNSIVGCVAALGCRTLLLRASETTTRIQTPCFVPRSNKIHPNTLDNSNTQCVDLPLVRAGSTRRAIDLFITPKITNLQKYFENHCSVCSFCTYERKTYAVSVAIKFIWSFKITWISNLT